MSLLLMSGAHRDNKWHSDVTVRRTSGPQLSPPCMCVFHHKLSRKHKLCSNVHVHANMCTIYAKARPEINVGI